MLLLLRTHLAAAANCRVGGELVRRLLGAAAGYLQQARVPEISDVLFGLSSLVGPQFEQWLGQALSAVPEVSLVGEVRRPWGKKPLGSVGQASARPLGTCRAQDKQRIFAGIQGYMPGGQRFEVTRKSVTDTVYDFSDLCRRNRRSQEAAITTLLSNINLGEGLPPPPPPSSPSPL